MSLVRPHPSRPTDASSCALLGPAPAARVWCRRTRPCPTDISQHYPFASLFIPFLFFLPNPDPPPSSSQLFLRERIEGSRWALPSSEVWGGWRAHVRDGKGPRRRSSSSSGARRAHMQARWGTAGLEPLGETSPSGSGTTRNPRTGRGHIVRRTWRRPCGCGNAPPGNNSVVFYCSSPTIQSDVVDSMCMALGGIEAPPRNWRWQWRWRNPHRHDALVDHSGRWSDPLCVTTVYKRVLFLIPSQFIWCALLFSFAQINRWSVLSRGWGERFCWIDSRK
jgi:hypothetical protein